MRKVDSSITTISTTTRTGIHICLFLSLSFFSFVYSIISLSDSDEYGSDLSFEEYSDEEGAAKHKKSEKK